MSRRSFGDIRLDPPDRSGPVEATWDEEARTITTPDETFEAQQVTAADVCGRRGGVCSLCRLRGRELTGDDPCQHCAPDEVFR